MGAIKFFSIYFSIAVTRLVSSDSTAKSLHRVRAISSHSLNVACSLNCSSNWAVTSAEIPLGRANLAFNRVFRISESRNFNRLIGRERSSIFSLMNQIE